MASEEPDDLDLLTEDADLEDDELDEEEEEDEDEELGEEEGEEGSNLDDGLPSKRVEKFQSKITTKEHIYTEMYQSKYRSNFPRLTKYERVKVLQVRASLIANGAPTLVDVGDLKDPREIAKKELDAGLCPIIIRRPLPSKSLKNPLYEYHRVNGLMS